MKIEDQVCTYKQAVELFNLGVKYKPYFFHTLYKDGSQTIMVGWLTKDTDVNIPAYTASELFEMCLKETTTYQNEFPDIVDVGYIVGIVEQHSDKLTESDWNTKPMAHGLADILIHLIRTGQTKVEDINKLS